MQPVAYYNEKDPFAAEWLRKLIAAGLIAYGDVDERDVRDVPPQELRGYTQCHFFAGIGVWSYALRRAGWPDNRPVWTGSCPCQPFSTAGQGAGFDDERHLWPFWHHLIRVKRPRVVFGEQVASKDGLAWLDLVQDDMEGTGYAFGALDLCAAGFGAPHIRQRLFFVGNADKPDQWGHRGRIRGSGVTNEVAPREADGNPTSSPGKDSNVGDTGGPGLEERRSERSDDAAQRAAAQRTSSAVDGFWRDAEWIKCTDGKARPVRPGTFPLAYGASARVGRLRGYGNAIVAPAAEEFIRAAMQGL